MVAVTDSHWLAKEAKLGLWRDHRVESISNGVPLDLYRMTQRAVARKSLGISTDGVVLLVAAQRLDNRHKGVALLVEAMQHVRHRPLTLMIQGHGDFSVEDSSISLLPLGFIADEARRVQIYNAADALVHPAINDNSPLVVLEAMACGTPVIAFPIGGVPELVRPGKTGWLAEAVSAAALAQAIDLAASDLAIGIDLRATCRSIVEAEYSDVAHAQAYINLMQSISKTTAHV
ncbi:D-inositol 3-phosphate glycosyltransferase [Chloroflexota bacterium]|nr:D-inositol 3-phosphate glycosyltransferase [Chloroflexota bacterium]